MSEFDNSVGIIIDPYSPLGKEMKEVSESLSTYYVCDNCGRLSETRTCPYCGSPCHKNRINEYKPNLIS